MAPGSWRMLHGSSHRCVMATVRSHNDMGDHFAKATSGRHAPLSTAAIYMSSLSLLLLLPPRFCFVLPFVSTEHTPRSLVVLLPMAILGFGVLYSHLASRLSLGRWCPDPRTTVFVLVQISEPLHRVRIRPIQTSITFIL